MIDWLATVVNRVVGRASGWHAIGRLGRQRRARRDRDAITLLSDAFESSGDADRAKELVVRRYEAAMRGRFKSGARAWPPDAADLFPGSTCIPEVSGARFSAAALAAGIVHHSGLIVRGLLSKDEVERCTSSVRHAFDAFDRYRSGVASPHDAKWYHPFESRRDPWILRQARQFAENGEGILGADSPATIHEVLKMAESRGVVAAAAAFLSERPAVSVMKTTLRIVKPATGTWWHQDGAFLGSDVRSVNMWIALSECGEDAPSLDMVPKRFDHIVPTGVEGAQFDWSVADCVAKRAARDADVEIQHLEFAPGDAVFFDHMNLHRTGTRPGMTKERMAIEWWFFAPSCFPMQQIPLFV